MKKPVVRLRQILAFTPVLCYSVVHAQPQPPDEAALAALADQSEIDPRVQADGEPWTVDTSSREETRQFYRTMFGISENVPSGWTGNTATGEAGDTSDAFKEAVKDRVNFYRAMAGVPANVTLNSTFSAKAQEGALMMSANNAISHLPPTDWIHYTTDGSEAAGKSNLAIGPNGPDSITGYILDNGSNNTEVGHRRWIFYPQTQEMGTGDVEEQGDLRKANVLWVQDSRFSDPRPSVRDEFVAWPPKGNVPYQLVWPRWSFTLPDADYSGTTVTMTRGGTPVGVQIEEINQNLGDEASIVWLYDGKTGLDDDAHPRPSADTTYTVTLSGVSVNGESQDFSYDVVVFDPNTAGSDAQITTVSGTDTPGTGGPSSYEVAVPTFATGFQWRDLETDSFNTIYGAESSLDGLIDGTTDGFTPRNTELAASGGGAYHLTHANGSANETLTLPRTYLIPAGGSGSLSFASRLGFSTTDQFSRVEISLNDGVSWSIIDEQIGNDSSTDSNYVTRSIDLTGFAGQTIQLRFAYFFDTGSFFNQTDTAVGWLIDDITLSGALSVTAGAVSTQDTDGKFDYTPSTSGERGLQARGVFFNNYGMDWGPVLSVNADNGSGSGSGGTGGVDPVAGNSRIINLSVRSGAGTGAASLNVGMVVAGSGNKPLLLRAIGPTLGGFGVPGVVSDPALEVRSGDAVIATNDNWAETLSSTFNSVGAFPLETDSADAALLLSRGAGVYPAVVDTKDTTGIVLVEAYDTQAVDEGGARQVNVSARTEVGTGANVLVAGFAISGTGTKTLLIRAVGATLAEFGVPGALQDPELVIRPLGEETVIASNNDWNNNAEIASTSATLGAFALSSTADAAILVTLNPGTYTATVSGVDETTGVALVEVYEVE